MRTPPCPGHRGGSSSMGVWERTLPQSAGPRCTAYDRVKTDTVVAVPLTTSNRKSQLNWKKALSSQNMKFQGREAPRIGSCIDSRTQVLSLFFVLPPSAYRLALLTGSKRLSFTQIVTVSSGRGSDVFCKCFLFIFLTEICAPADNTHTCTHTHPNISLARNRSQDHSKSIPDKCHQLIRICPWTG